MIFERIGSPYKKQAQADIEKIKQKMAKKDFKKLFEKILKELGIEVRQD